MSEVHAREAASDFVHVTARAAGILLRLGQPDLLGRIETPVIGDFFKAMSAAGDALFSNLPLLFAVAPAVGRAKLLGVNLPWLLLGLLSGFIQELRQAAIGLYGITSYAVARRRAV